MFQSLVMQAKLHKNTLIKVGAAVAGAVLGGVVAAILVREEEEMVDDGMILDPDELEEGDDESDEE